MARAAKTQSMPMATPGAPPAAEPATEVAAIAAPDGKRPKAEAAPIADAPSLVAEREANELLAKGDQAAATAKFVEADRLEFGGSRQDGSGWCRGHRAHRLV